MKVTPIEIEYEGRRYRLVEEWSSQKFRPRERHFIAPLNIPTVGNDLRFDTTCANVLEN